jgi:hypothetical protein
LFELERDIDDGEETNGNSEDGDGSEDCDGDDVEDEDDDDRKSGCDDSDGSSDSEEDGSDSNTDNDGDDDVGGIRGYVRQQVDRYLRAPKLQRAVQLPGGKVHLPDPLLWWKKNSKDFPEIAELAMRVLCIQATSAPCERLFSHAGLTIANDRARLTPDTAETFIFLHDAWDAVEKLRLEERI